MSDKTPERVDEWLRHTDGVVNERPGKQMISIRLDPDIIAFFRSGGRNYQSRISAILRSYVDHCRLTTSPTNAAIFQAERPKDRDADAI